MRRELASESIDPKPNAMPLCRRRERICELP